MSMDLEMEEIAKVFFEESFEGLDIMESSLLNLDANADREVINTIFRAAHSIKGGAGTFGFMEISGFTHSVETLLDEMRNGKRGVTPDAVQALLQSVDVIREMTQSAQAKRPIDMTRANALSRELTDILENRIPGVSQASLPVEAAPAVVAAPQAAAGWAVKFVPDRSLFATCNDPLRIFTELAKLGPCEAKPSWDKLPEFHNYDPTQCYLAWDLTLNAAVERQQLADVFDWVDANSLVECQPLGGAPQDAQAVSAVAPTAVPAETPAAAEAPSKAAAAPAKSGGDVGSIRVSTDKVDALINLVGELVITQSMLGRFGEHYDPSQMESLRQGLAQLTRNTRELQESVMQIRMLPIGFSFNRFPRLVHDLSRKLGKKVDLKLTGEGTELDKTVLEKIGDPLVHLVRNALDHGLESPEARLAAGKSETGTLELNAFHEGGNIIIEVKDDGAGINKARVLKKAQERGLVSPEQELSDDQVHNLIFAPGFSTADTISDVSGRGVGMDVVRRNINDLGGHVQIFSNEGRGSTIRIRLPLTLAILDGQLVRVGKDIFVVSLVSIVETIQPKRERINSVAGRAELFQLRDEYLPIIRLYDLFDAEPDSREIEKGLLVVVEADRRKVGILVDELLAQQQVVIKSLETNFKQVQGIAGATILGDGTVALIVDVPGLVMSFFSRQSQRLEAAA